MANIPTLTDEQREALLQRQYGQALAGSEALLIHLGKTYLNQHDKAHLIVEKPPFTEYSLEELQQLLLDRANELAEAQAVADLGQALLLPKAR
jgi:hypothetical protein